MIRILVLAAVAALCLALSPSAAAADVIGPKLAERLLTADADTQISVMILMKDRVGGQELEALAAGLSKADRRRAVCGHLKAHAAASQAGVREIIQNEVPRASAAEMKYLWINNTIGGWLTPPVIRKIAQRDDVGVIELNIPRPAFIGPNAGEDAVPELLKAPKANRANVWSLEWIDVDDAWALYGFDGTGVVVGMVDTGTDYNHTDLNGNTWVNPGEDINGNGVVWDTADFNGIDDDGNGYVDDLVGYDFGDVDNNPMDDYGHGTHTAGNVGGDGTGGTQTGVAPGCKLMHCKVGYYINVTDELSMLEGMQYTADNGADVLSMSMGWAHDWDPQRSLQRDTCVAVKAAGTVLVLAAGNERGWYSPPHCIRTPGDCPEVISVAASGYMTNNYASFSSEGPTVWEEPYPYNDYPYPPGLLKPDITAPGESVISTIWGGGYGSNSGTSMATPHIAGVCALMLDANPDLTPDDVQMILEDTAIDLGSAGKDKDYGAGMVDTPAAVLTAMTGVTQQPKPDIKINGLDGTVSVHVSEYVTVTVSLDPGDLDGEYADWWLYVKRAVFNTWWCQYKGGSMQWTKSLSDLRFAGVTLRTVNDAVVLGPRLMPSGTYDFTFSVDEKNGVREDTFTDSVFLIVSN